MFIKPNFLLLEYLNRSPQEKKKKRISRKEMDRFEARGYQLEMLEQSLQENIIFVVRENLVMITDECMQHLTAKDGHRKWKNSRVCWNLTRTWSTMKLTN